MRLYMYKSIGVMLVNIHIYHVVGLVYIHAWSRFRGKGNQTSSKTFSFTTFVHCVI